MFADVVDVLSASRLEVLASALASDISNPLDDPMAAEWIAVPSSGLQRWLTLELARQVGTSGPGRSDGVAGNLDLFFPGTLTRRILAPGPRGQDDPWDVERVAWKVLEVFDEHSDDEALAHIGRPAEGSSRWRRARHCADLFDRYVVHRPDMVTAWTAGSDIDGTGSALAERSLWQPQLWRLVRERIGVPCSAELAAQRLGELRSEGPPAEVPARVSVFGITTIPGGQPFLELLDSLAAHREVRLYLHDPSPLMAKKVVDSVAATGRVLRDRSEDRSTGVVKHPLLRSWARPSREAALLLESGSIRAERLDAAEPGGDVSQTLLSKLQDDIRDDRLPGGDFTPERDDRSLRIHSCFGPTRQVEVLRDEILHLLADDPSMTEEDIVVLCPRLDEFAPLVESVFGPPAPTAPLPGEQTEAAPATAGGTPRISYRITDRSLRRTHSLLGSMGALVELIGSRFSDAALMDFVSLEPVRVRFRFGDDDLARIADWVETANTRWGLDGEHRSAWGVPAEYEGCTWATAVDRLMMGIAVSDDPSALAVGEISPIGVEGSNVAVAGRFADLLSRLARLADKAAGHRTVRKWTELLQTAAAELFELEDPQSWQYARLTRTLEGLADAARSDGVDSDVPLELADVRHLLGSSLLSTPGRPDFFRGGVTIASFTPLRGIPYRAVILLGMDETSFSTGAPDGDDLAAAVPRLGDRDRRNDSRAALLDSVLAAESRLSVIRTSRSVTTNREVPSAVVVSELCEVISSTLDPRCRKQVMQSLEVEHPLQSFDERNFYGDPWSFDPLARDAAVARRSDIGDRQFLPRRLDADHDAVIDLAELQSFTSNPTRYFCRKVLEITLPDDPQRSAGAGSLQTIVTASGLEPAAAGSDLLLALGGLDNWKLKDRLLEHLLDGGDVDSFRRREQAADLLPAGRLGDAALTDALEAVQPLVDGLETLGTAGQTPQPVPIEVTLGDGTRVVGTVRNNCGHRPGPVRASVSSYQRKHKLPPWVDLLALTAADPSRDWLAVHLHTAKSEAGFTARPFEIPRADADDRLAVATECLEMLVDLYRRGQREPLPLFEKLSPALHDNRSTGSTWHDSYGGRGDGDDKWVQIAFGPISLDEILAVGALDDDPPGPAGGRVQRYANLLWGALDESTSAPETVQSEEHGAMAGDRS